MGGVSCLCAAVIVRWLRTVVIGLRQNITYAVIGCNIFAS